MNPRSVAWAPCNRAGGSLTDLQEEVDAQSQSQEGEDCKGQADRDSQPWEKASRWW